METTVTYRLKDEDHVRTFATANPYNAMRNLSREVDMMYAVGTYKPLTPAKRCCGDKNCIFEREQYDDMLGW